MKTTFKSTIDLSADDVSDIIRHHFDLPETASVRFTISSAGDRPGMDFQIFSGAVVESQVPNPKAKKPPVLRSPERGGPLDC